MYQREANMAEMGKRQEPGQVHCYTNPSFCRQSEFIHEDSHSDTSDLPPPPQFQVDDLPPPPAILQPQPQYGQSNPAFHGSPESELTSRAQPHHRSVVNLNHTAVERYCYIDDSSVEPPANAFQKRYGSLPLGGPDRRPYNAYNRTHRYEYIPDEASVLVHQQPLQPQQLQQIAPVVNANASRYEFIEQQQLQQRAAPTPQPPQSLQPLQPIQHQQQQQQQQQPQPHTPTRQNSIRASYRSADAHYTTLGPDGVEPHDAHHWNDEDGPYNTSRRQINTPKGRYTSVPMQEEYPPSLPERNGLDTSTQRVNSATQKLHEILTTPRKPRKRSQSEALSPIKSPPQLQPMLHSAALSPRATYSPGCSPSSAAGHRAMNSPARQQQQQQQQQQQRAVPSPRSVKGPTTSTPNKEPPGKSAKRCLAMSESMLRRHIEDSHAAAYGRSPGRHGRFNSPAEEAMYIEHKKAPDAFYHVESAFNARTAVVPPLSPPGSEANTTLVSGTEKSDRKNAPLLLVLVGILTCGLAIYLSSTQGRRYYFDSAVGCGACCALAGASRSLRRTWTGLGLAGLAALSCAGLLLMAAKSPRPGSPMHDLTAGALCGVSLLGAALAFLALLQPRCALGRHHRVHSWIPSFSA